MFEKLTKKLFVYYGPQSVHYWEAVESSAPLRILFLMTYSATLCSITYDSVIAPRDS
jgi:hypothetical protein